MEDIKEKTADEMFEELGYKKPLTGQEVYLKNKAWSDEKNGRFDPLSCASHRMFWQ